MPIPAQNLEDARRRIQSAFRSSAPARAGLLLVVREEGEFLCLDLQSSATRPRPLCRLRWAGNPGDWDLEMWSPMEQEYDRSSEHPVEGGAPEQCLLAALDAASLAGGAGEPDLVPRVTPRRGPQPASPAPSTSPRDTPHAHGPPASALLPGEEGPLSPPRRISSPDPARASAGQPGAAAGPGPADSISAAAGDREGADTLGDFDPDAHGHVGRDADGDEEAMSEAQHDHGEEGEREPPDRELLLEDARGLLREIQRFEAFLRSAGVAPNAASPEVQALHRRRQLLLALEGALGSEPLHYEELCGAEDLLAGAHHSLRFLIPDLLDAIPEEAASGLDDLPFGEELVPFWHWALRWSAGQFPSRGRIARLLARPARVHEPLGLLLADFAVSGGGEEMELLDGAACVTICKLLGAAESENVVAHLIEMLYLWGDWSRSLDAIATWALAQQGERAFAPLADRIRQDAEDSIVTDVAPMSPAYLADLALYRPGLRAHALDRLRSWLRTRVADEHWRAQVCRALMCLGGPEAQFDIRSALRRDVCLDCLPLRDFRSWVEAQCPDAPQRILLPTRPILETFLEVPHASARRWKMAQDVPRGADPLRPLLEEEGWRWGTAREVVGLAGGGASARLVPSARTAVGRDRPLPPSVFVPRVARNADCPCGSGKKYKKCCLDKDAASAAGNTPGPRPTSADGEALGPSRE
ncbi:MAG: SEC-C domain-containing protein [Planctomycetes bacterium]|nr:SEC-C domain-containing protein [Planctomycetota bacterium]